MIHPYDRFYLSHTMNKLANLYEQAVLFENIDIDKFTEIFLSSEMCKAFEEADFIYILGKSSNEILAIILDQDPKSYKQKSYASPEYWVGYILAYTQWALNISYREIIDHIKASDILNLYFPYHEMDERQFVDYIRTIIPKENKLKELRLKRNYSQSTLSLLSKVPIRNIRAYEQGTIEISKASGETLYALAKALHCGIEELIL